MSDNSIDNLVDLPFIEHLESEYGKDVYRVLGIGTILSEEDIEFLKVPPVTIEYTSYRSIPPIKMNHKDSEQRANALLLGTKIVTPDKTYQSLSFVHVKSLEKTVEAKSQ